MIRLPRFLSYVLLCGCLSIGLAYTAPMLRAQDEEKPAPKKPMKAEAKKDEAKEDAPADEKKPDEKKSDDMKSDDSAKPAEGEAKKSDEAKPAEGEAKPAEGEAKKSDEAKPAEGEAKPAEGEKPAAEAGPTSLRQTVEDFWHYGKIARYDLAAAEANKILAESDPPGPVLEAFESVATARKDNLDQWMLRWQANDQLKEPVTKLLGVLRSGYEARRADQGFIEKQIQELAVNERAYSIAMSRLRASGEVAVPLMIDYLRNPEKSQYHAAIRRALRDMGRTALNPLVAATEMKNPEGLMAVVSVLGNIGFSESVPYMARIANDNSLPETVRSTAAQSLANMGAGNARTMNAGELFYDLAEKFYYDNAAISADARTPMAFVWFWDEEKGLMKKGVPPAIFNEIMAMRAAEYALKLNPGKSDAVSLWLAANFKRETQLPEGAADPTRPEGTPKAHYFGVAAGTQYLNAALSRAIHDRDSAVALRVIKSLQDIVGQSNLFTGQGAPMIDALRYPDRLVRYEAALALASALPQQGFAGQERVVPLLADAVAQTGKANILVVVPSQDDLNKLIDGLKGQGYGATGATSAEAAMSAAATLPAVDVIVISEDVGAAQIDRIVAMAGANMRLERTPKVIITKTPASPYASQAVHDPLLNATQASDAAGLKPVIEKARQRGGSLALDEKLATSYALRAADMLGRVAINRSPVFDVSAAQSTLLTALDDTRPDVVKATGNVLGLINSKAAQSALLTKASDDKTTDDVKVSLYKSLATSAKFLGNQLDAAQIDGLQKTVAEAQNLDVRGAAAEARGALNLPADQAKTLIVQQSTVLGGGAKKKEEAK